MTLDSWFPLSIVMLATCVGAVTDVWKFRVYNALTIPLFLSGLAYHAIFHGWSGFSSSLLGGLFGFGVLLLPYALGLMGGGDVKLLAGVGAWLGLTAIVVVFVASALVTGVYALAAIAIRGKLRESMLTIKLIFYRVAALGVHLGRDDLVEEVVSANDRRLRVIPFGAMVPLGVIAATIWFVYYK